MTTLKIMSFNLRTPSENDGINFFPNRRPRIRAVIEEQLPDLIGFQETADDPRAWLEGELPGLGYIMAGCGRGPDYRGESVSIAWRAERFSLISLENIWLSHTPSTPGSRYNGDQSSCPRMFTAARLWCRDAAREFIFINTHLDHKGPNARLLASAQLLEYISRHKQPFVMTGDFNAYPDSSCISMFTEFADRKINDLAADAGATFHAFGKLDKPSKIDYIFSDLPAAAQGAFVVRDDGIDGLYISDHNPVCAWVEL